TAGILAAESARISPAARLAVQDFFERLHAWIEAQLLDLGKSKKESRTLSAVILTSIEGSLLIDSIEGPEHLDDTRGSTPQPAGKPSLSGGSYLADLRRFISGL